MRRKWDVFAILTSLAVIAPVAAMAAQDSLLSPNNPNCSPGVRGCTANYPASNVSTENPPPQSSAVPEGSNGGPGSASDPAGAPPSEAKPSGQNDDASQK